MTPASVRTRDRRTEARTGPLSRVPPQRQSTSGLPRRDLTTRELATHEKDPLTASSGQPPERGGVTGHRERVPGSDPVPVVTHTYAVTAPSGLSDGAHDAPYGTGSGPSESPPS